MQFKALLLGATLVAGAVVGSAADATELLFDYTGSDGTFQFTSTDTPTPYDFRLNQNTAINPASYSNGIVFYSAGFSGGFDNFRGIGNNYGAQIYSGSEDAPVFTAGVFAVYTDYFHSTQKGVLTISEVAGVPEPASWAMMLVGFGATGLALRSRRRATIRFS